jgi:diphthamide synthase (EF-2-diphthine--ammonia ligase)
MFDVDRLKQVIEAGADVGVCAPLSEDGLSAVVASEAINQDIYRDLATAETRLTHKIRELTVLSDRYRTENEMLAKALRGVDRKYDVAISFAASERPLAEQLATMLRRAGLEVFYDDFYADVLWGKDLVVSFDDVFRKDSRFCVVFVSKEYLVRMWTNHERQSAQARALAERTREYLLPVQVDNCELPGMPRTIGYLSLRKYSIEEIGALLLRKILGGVPPDAGTAKLLDLIHRGVVTIRSLASQSPFPYVRCPSCGSEKLDVDAWTTVEDTMGFVRCSSCRWTLTDRDRPLWEE